MKDIYFIILYFLLFVFTSCSSIEEKVQGDWAITEIQAPFTILTNGIDLRKDHTCILPMSDISERHTNKEIGQWSILKEKSGEEYLQIVSENKFFNDKFKIESIEKVYDKESLGFLLKMTLVSQQTILVCIRPEF